MLFSPTTGCFYPQDFAYPCLPDDLIKVTAADHEAAMNRAPGSTLAIEAGALVILPSVPPSQALLNDRLQARLTAAVQVELDTQARARGYDSLLSLVSYSTSKVPRFAAEAKAALAWRDAVWQAATELLQDVVADKRAAPTPAELLAELPSAKWPA